MFPESLDLFLFLVLEALLLGSLLGLLSAFLVIIFNNFLLFFFNLKRPLLLDKNGLLVSLGDLLEHQLGLNLFLDGLLSLLLLHLMVGLDHELALFLDLFLGTDPLELSLLDLLDDHLVINLLLDAVLPLDLLGVLDGLEAVDFNHEVL